METLENGLQEEDELDDIIEKTSSKVKSIEEIRSHTIDEDLNDFKKTVILLKSNYEAQLIVGIKMVPQLLRLDKQNCIINVFPEFKEYCFIEDINRTQEFYLTLNSCLIEMLSSQLLSSKEFSFHFIDLITNKIYGYCDKPTDYETYSIYLLWTELMVNLIENLTDNCVKTAIFDLVPKSKLQFVSRRTREYISLILAKIAPKLSHQMVQTQLYPILIDLCNDTQHEVRTIACQSLSPVCKVLGPDVTMNMVVPEMSKYLCDESVVVKTTCFQSLVEILEIFEEQDDAKVYLLRKIQSFIDYGLSLKNELYLVTISKNIGTIASCLKEVMNSQSKSALIHVFYQICRDENLYIRRSLNESNYIWCKCKINLANSFPNVLLITNSINFENKLSHCLTSLIRDKNENVREAIVLKFIEIAHKLGSSQYFMIINDFCTSLVDDSPQVLNSAIKQLDKFLNLFIKKTDTNGILNESQQMPGYQLVTKRLIKLEESISKGYKYSLHVEILQAFSLLPWLICTDFLVDEILPILDKRLNARALPVRLAAIKSILIILRKIPRFPVRNVYFNKLLDFSLHSNCYKRIIFIEICKLIMQLYSKNFFKSNIYQSVIKLYNDPVINVRISFIKILPDLKRLCKVQSDKDKLENLEVIARCLLNDKDKDVSDLAYKAITQMDYIRTHSNSNDNEEQLNRVKEQEELLLMEHEPKKSQTKASNSNMPNNVKKPDQTNQNQPTIKKNQSQIKLSSLNISKSPPQNLNSIELSNRAYQQSQLQQIESLNIKEKKNLMPMSISAERTQKPRSQEMRRSSIEYFNQSNGMSNYNSSKLSTDKISTIKKK